jgi:hypothetical protein
MKTFSLISVLNSLQVVVKRFPIALLLLFGVAVLSWLEFNHQISGGYYVPFNLWVFCVGGTLVGITAALGVEHFALREWKKYLLTLVCVLLWGVYCLFLPYEDGQVHFDLGLQIFILGAVFVASAFFISFLKKNQDAAFWGFSRSAVMRLCEAVLFGGIIYVGLIVALGAIKTLFDVPVSEKCYVVLAIFCGELFAPIYFLATIPSKTEKFQADLSFPKVLKTLGLHILLPILGIYILILYAYLIKIIALWELPNGWVSILVSILAIGGLLVILILYPVWLTKENRVVNLFTRYFGLLILPLLVLMSVGIFRRIADYGITINRCYILLLNLWFYGIFIYLFLTKSLHIRWIAISPTVILLLASIGPWRVSNIVKHFGSDNLEILNDSSDINTPEI